MKNNSTKNVIESSLYCLLIQKCWKYFHQIHMGLHKNIYVYEITMLSSVSWIIYSTFESNYTISENYYLGCFKSCGQLPWKILEGSEGEGIWEDEEKVIRISSPEKNKLFSFFFFFFFYSDLSTYQVYMANKWLDNSWTISSAKEAEQIREGGCPDTQNNRVPNPYWLALEWIVHYCPSCSELSHKWAWWSSNLTIVLINFKCVLANKRAVCNW